jgi:Gnt-I system high-affinity gluconate transporter
MPLPNVMNSIKAGVGGTLGNLALVLAFGAMLGKLMADCGAAQRITIALSRFGNRWTPWTVMAAGFILGIPLFYEVGFVLLVPLVFTIGATTGIPLILLGVPMAAALSVTHGFLPPHPGPTAIAGFFKADLGLTLVYGVILALPIAALAGPVFAMFLKDRIKAGHKDLSDYKILPEAELPSFFVSFLTGLMPFFLMAASVLLNFSLGKQNRISVFFGFLGDPVMALLISVILAIFTFGIFRGRKMSDVMKSVSVSASSIAMILLVIGGGGAFKQVLVDSGVSEYIASLMRHTSLSPLVFAWSIAALLRISLGSATVAGLTAAGIVAPLLAAKGVSPELMVIATGAGSLIFSHVNDPGFWLFKEYFNLSISDTLKSWSVLETIISVGGLIGVLAINYFL